MQIMIEWYDLVELNIELALIKEQSPQMFATFWCPVAAGIIVV